MYDIIYRFMYASIYAPGAAAPGGNRLPNRPRPNRPSLHSPSASSTASQPRNPAQLRQSRPDFVLDPCVLNPNCCPRPTDPKPSPLNAERHDAGQ